MVRVLKGAGVLLLAVACGGNRAPDVSGARGPAAATASVTTSNVLRRDYAGQKSCAGCHGEIAAKFSAAPMHDMTRDAKTARIVAPFDGSVFRFKDDSATFELRGGQRFVAVRSAAFGNHDYRVTKIIGGRHREDFVGIAKDSIDEEILPVSYLVGPKRFRYKGYSVMSEERPGLKAGPVWKTTCIFCHNTVPLLSTELGLLSPGSRGYQGSNADKFLPPALRATVRVTDKARLAEALTEELAFLRGQKAGPNDDPQEVAALTATTLNETRGRFDERHVVDLGVGCEACHGGAKAHVKDPRVRPSFAPVGGGVEVSLPGVGTGGEPTSGDGGKSGRAGEINRACARCHHVLFSGYQPTWEGGKRAIDPGGSPINSGEARDFLLSRCASTLACTACHDPHERSDARAKATFETKAGDSLCVSCHGKFAAKAAREAHTHHSDDGAGGRCVSCHMPRKNMGLDGRLTRYHRIGSPTDAARVERDRPLECALCHADKTAGALLSDLERFWGKRYDRSRVERLYGGLDANILRTTAALGLPHEKAAALGALGLAKDRLATTIMAESLTHPIPLIREYARGALEATVGAPITFDVFGKHEDVVESAAHYLREHVATPRAPRPLPSRPPSREP